MSSPGSRSKVVLELAEEFLERYRRGERPSLKEYIGRHPSLAGEIREVFPAMAMMERIALADESIAGEATGEVPWPIGIEARRFGDYRIVREIGRGGMGVVYEAEQVSLGRQVALKLLPPEAIRGPNQRHRFEREARAAGRLHHTNIVPVFGVGEHEGTPYYVMQFIRGLGLDEVLRELKRLWAVRDHRARAAADMGPGDLSRGISAVAVACSLMSGRFERVATTASTADIAAPDTATLAAGPPPASGPDPGDLPADLDRRSSPSHWILGSSEGGAGGRSSSSRPTYWQGVARIGSQVADALDYAHKQGVIHRDVKPSNLLLDARGTAWVADFGLAKASDQKDLTDTGDLLGTLRYIPPEAFEGGAGALGDVYSLGLTLYELLALRPAFGERDRARLIQDVTTAAVERLRTVNPEIPRDLETIVHKAIERDPAHRYASAGDLAADLQRFLDDEPIRARRLSQVERLGRWSRRNKTVAALAGTLAAVLVVGFVIMAVLRSRAEESASVARANEATSKVLAAREAAARAQAQAQERFALEKAELLAREDYANRVNRAYREVEDDNVALAEDLLHGCPAERRGWEWHFVERLCNSERLRIDLGRANVSALAFGPDGTWAVSGEGGPGMALSSQAEWTVGVWDVGSGRLRKSLPGARGAVFGIAVSPDGRWIAAGFGAGLLQLWDAETGRVAWTRTDRDLNVMSVAFSPDSKSLAAGYGYYSGDVPGRVRIRDVSSGAEKVSFAASKGGAHKVAFHPDGRRLAVACEGVVEVRDIETGAMVQRLEGHEKWVYCLAYSPDGKWLATGGWDRTVKLRDAATGAEVTTIFGHGGFVMSLAFAPDGRSLVTTSEDRSCRIWEVPSGRQSAAFHGHTDFVQAVAFRPDGREVATASLDGSIRFWDLRTSRPVVIGHTGWVEGLAYRGDGLRVLSESGRFRVEPKPTRGWDPRTGEPDPALAGPGLEKPPAGFTPGSRFEQTTVESPDGRLIAEAGKLGAAAMGSRSKEYTVSAVIIRDRVGGRVVHTLTGHSADVVSLAFSPDGRRLATASYDRTIKLWDVRTGQDVFTIRGHNAGVISLAFSPAGDRLVSGGIDATARVWNAEPLPPVVRAEHDARYQKKRETLAKLSAETDDVRRGEILAGNGQWALAAEVFASAVRRQPDEPKRHIQLIDALIQAGDRSRVGPACAGALERFGNASDPLLAMIFAGLDRLAPGAFDDPEKRRAIGSLAATADNTQRGWILASAGLWDLVAHGFTRHVEAMHKDGEAGGLPCFGLQLVSLVESGDLAGYRAAAAKLASRFGKSTDPHTLNNAAWLCTYAPDAVPDLAIPVRMAEAALAGYRADQRRFALNTLGAALYRAGRIDEAIARLDESVRASGGVGVPQDWAFLAMAYHTKGRRDEARRWIEKLRSHEAGERRALAANLVECRFLRREAEAMLREGSPAHP